MNGNFLPDGFNIELTTCCPLRCPQCYCSLEGGKHISLNRAVSVLHQAAALGVTHVELSGGETMCYPHLYEVIAEARKLGIAPSIATSGWNFDDTVLKNLIEAGVDMIYISLNGPTEESNRETRDGFALSMEALETIRRNHFTNAAINWVMHRDSVPLLPQMIELAGQYGIDTILIIEPKPTSSGDLDTYPTLDQIHYVADLVKHQKGSVQLVIQHCFSQLLALSCENKLWGNRNRGVYKGCTAGIASFCVNVDGLFSPCRHLEYFEKWDTLEDYWRHSPILNQIRSLEETKKEPCLSCKYSNYCRHCLTVNSKCSRDLYIGNEHCPLATRS